MASISDNIVYIARDIERALGIKPVNNYYIITNKTEYALEVQREFPDNVFVIDSPNILDTYGLLLQESVSSLINTLNASILVFKNTIHIEALCSEKKWKLLNPSAELSEKVENKISQSLWLNELSSLLPTHKIQTVKDTGWNNEAFIIQWSHGHTGDGTILVQNEKTLTDLKNKFPHRECKVTKYIKGPMFTVNIVVTDTVILLGNISYQITGMLPFTENAFSTIGNDWSVTYSILSENHIIKFNSIAEKVAQKMQTSGWRGLFGIDVVYDEERDELHLIEINARQPASTTYESELQTSMGIEGLNTFEAHLMALSAKSIKSSLIPINDGAQILQRVTSTIKEINTKKLLDAGYKVIKYANSKPNADLVRIQSEKGIMEAHNKLNKRGKEILDLIS